MITIRLVCEVRDCTVLQKSVLHFMIVLGNQLWLEISLVGT